jgi:hypothetical protein
MAAAKVIPKTAAGLNDADTARLLDRERQLIRIINEQAIPNEDERNMKISYYSNSSLPIEEMDCDTS